MNAVKAIWEVSSIRGAYESNELSASEAVELLASAKLRRSWHTQEWKERRNAFIGKSCTQCSSTKQPLVLQHNWHPRSLDVIWNEVLNKFYPTYVAEHPQPSILYPEASDIRDACPTCNSIRVTWRKTSDDWRCAKCRNICKKPCQVLGVAAETEGKWRRERTSANRQWYADFRKSVDPLAAPLVLQSYFADHDRYLSFKDTTTFCKKCAFLWDKKKQRFCRGCSQYFPLWMNQVKCANCMERIIGLLGKASYSICGPRDI